MMNKDITIPISIGELIDKITILEIKMNHVKGRGLDNIKKELLKWNISLKNSQISIKKDLVDKLRKVNTDLWSIEDRIIIQEKEKSLMMNFFN